MILDTLKPQLDTIIYLCTVCVTDNNGGKIALTIIVLSLILLGIGNWAWQKYFHNKKEISPQK